MGAQANTIEHFQTPFERLVLATAKHLHLGERQVLRHGQVRKQLEVLKHHADPAA
ncbi:hypothetical protein D9M73_224500 [compost metagenome]